MIKKMCCVGFILMFLALPISIVNAKGPEAYIFLFTGTYGIAVTNTGGPAIIEVSITVHGTTISGVTPNYEGWTIVQDTTTGGEDRVTWTASTNKVGIRSQRYSAFGFTLSGSPTSISWTASTKKTVTASTDYPPYPLT